MTTVPTATAAPVSIPESVRHAASVLIEEASGEVPGVSAWMQTLNSLYRQEAEQEAHFTTALAMTKFRRGEPLYNAYLNEYAEADKGELINSILVHERNTGKAYIDAINKFPIKMPPDKVEGDDDEKYIEKVAAYNKHQETVIDQRTKFVEDKMKVVRKEWEKTDFNKIVEKAIKIFVGIQYSMRFRQWLRANVLYRAIRKSDNHRAFFYSSVEEVADLDDAILEYLDERYNTLDTIKADDIPT